MKLGKTIWTTLALVALTAHPAQAVIESFTDEAAYLAALAAAGYDTMIEDFEGAAWDQYRTYGVFDPNAVALTITSFGITWSGNDYLSTNQNWGRDWTWGLFTVYTGTLTPEWFRGESSQTLYAVGGWIKAQQTDVGIVIDGQVVADRPISVGHQFLGVVVPAGFTTFDIVDLEQHTSMGVDDFTFALAASLQGDLDGDCDVDLGDLAQLLANYGVSSGATYEQGDLDGDGDVDLSDLAALLANYGQSCP